MSAWLPPAASAHAASIDTVIGLAHLLMAALFLGWSAYFVWVLHRFRAGRQPKASPASASGRTVLGIEITVITAEVLLLVGVALPVWYSRTSAAPPETDIVRVRVVAEQFAWNIHYPGSDGVFGETSLPLVTPENPIGLDRTSPSGADDIVIVNQLHLPVNRAAAIELSSKDVIHSFGVPAMRVKQDAIPGTRSAVWFTPTSTGRFDIVCSQLCGLAHFRMRGMVIVESDADFAAFLTREAERR